MIWRRRFIYSALFATLIVGCGQVSPQMSQSSSSTQPVAVAQAPCANTYMPVKAGASWTYASANNVTKPSTQTNTITDVGASSFTLKSDLVSGVTWTETWTCTPGGLLQLQNNGGPLSAALNGPNGKGTVTTKSNTGITMPPDPKVGDTWSQTTVVVVNGSITISTTTNAKAVGPESVTVPAGTFDAMRIDAGVDAEVTFADGKKMPSTSTLTTWWVSGKGMVKASATTGGIEQSVRLQSYQIP